MRRVLCFAITLVLALVARGQDSSAVIDQARLHQDTTATTPSNVTANGVTLPAADTSGSGDDSFGAQQILKTQEKVPELTLSGDASFFYTNNVALTHHDTISDTFFVGNAGVSWTPRVNREWQLQFGARASIFRYQDTSELDFQSLGAGAGVAWTPQNAWGIGFFARYDFIELLNRHSDEILQDHEFSFAAQKIIPLGRSHALSFSLIGSAGISDPFAEQRDQVGAVLGYRLQLSRNLDADVGYRHSWYFYNSGGRTDLNQILFLNLHYHVTPWASVEAFLSGATNYSNHSVFKYDVLTSGGGVAVVFRF